jgi:hypothetical protein
MADIAFFKVTTAVLLPAMTLTLRRTNWAAISASRSGRPSDRFSAPTQIFDPSSPWIAVIPLLSAECECKYAQITGTRGSLKLIIGHFKGKGVFNNRLLGRLVHHYPL